MQDHNIALGSERDSSGPKQAAKFALEYWPCYLVLINF